MKTKPIAPVNKTAELVNNHLKKESITTMNHAEVDAMFETPAEVINHFSMINTPSLCRIAFCEKDSSNNSHVRSVVAFDYMTLFKLGELINSAIQKVIAQNQPADAEKTEAEAKKDENAAPTDETKAAVDIKV